jgi:flagellar biosynthesis protein FliQ
LYWLLFANETRIIDLSRQGSWSSLILIAIALIFSFVHGAFTSQFWDLLGLRAKK